MSTRKEAVIIPGSSGSDDPLGGIITFPSADFFDNFFRFCSIGSIQTVSSTAGLRFNDPKMSLLPIGQPISLSALVPRAGDACPEVKYRAQPESENGESPEKTILPSAIPLNAVVDFQWKIQVKNINLADKPLNVVFPKEERQALGSDGLDLFETVNNQRRPVLVSSDKIAVPGTDYTILSGNLNSRQLTIMPTPHADARAFQFSLLVNLWWPAKPRTMFTIPMTQEIAARGTTKYKAPLPSFLHCALEAITQTSIPKPPLDDLYSKFAELASVQCQQLPIETIPPPGAVPTLGVAGLTTPFELPLGQALALSSQLPSPDTVVPVGGIPLPDGKSVATPGGLPLGTVVSVKWHVETADYVPKADLSLSSLTFKSSRAGDSHGDAGGRFEVLAGGLTLPTLTIVPWPESSVTPLTNEGRYFGAPSKLRRAFRIRLEVTVKAPTRPEQNFFLPPQEAPGKARFFVGVVKSWAETFSVPEGGQFGRLPTPAELSELKSLPDPTQFFRDMFTPAAHNLTPEPGQITKLLVKPTSKVTAIPAQLKEITDKKPNTKIEAVVDYGAVLENTANAALNLLGLKPDTNPAAKAAVSVVDLISKIFAIPIAVDINGNTVTKTLTPLTPLPVPSLDSVDAAPESLVPGGLGSPAILGSIPIGSLKTMVGAASRDLIAKSDDLGQSIIQKTPLSGEFGLSFLPIPELRSFGERAPKTVNFSLSLNVHISVPGSTSPMTLQISLGKLPIAIPTIGVPQVLCLTRASLAETPDWNNAEHTDQIWVVDPLTAPMINKIQTLSTTLTTLGAVMNKMIRIFSAAEFQELSLPIGDWVKLIDTVNKMTERLVKGSAIAPPTLVALGPNDILNLDEVRYGRSGLLWYFNDKNGFSTGGVSGFMWIGLPRSKWGFSMLLDNKDSWIPYGRLPSHQGTKAAGSIFPDRDKDNMPIRYTTYSFTTLEFDRQVGYANLSLRLKTAERSFYEDAYWDPSRIWQDRVKKIRVFETNGSYDDR